MLHFFSCASFTGSSSPAFASSDWPVPEASLLELGVAAAGLVLGAVATSFFFFSMAAGFAAFFAATGLTPSFGAAFALKAFFGAKGTADLALCEVVVTLALGNAAFAFAETTLGFEDDAVLLTATTLGFDGAVLAFV